jgi:uncharacterized protein YjbI with pentapeptide repeats
MVEEQADSVTAAKPTSNIDSANFSSAHFADFGAADWSAADLSVSPCADAALRRKNPWFATATRQIFFVYSRL